MPICVEVDNKEVQLQRKVPAGVVITVKNRILL